MWFDVKGRMPNGFQNLISWSTETAKKRQTTAAISQKPDQNRPCLEKLPYRPLGPPGLPDSLVVFVVGSIGLRLTNQLLNAAWFFFQVGQGRAVIHMAPIFARKKTPFLVLGKNGSTKLKISTFRPNIETSYYDFWEILARLCFIKMYRKVMYFGVSFWRTNQLWPSQLKQLKLDKQTAQHILLTSCMMRWCYHVLWTPWMQESVYIHYYVI